MTKTTRTRPSKQKPLSVDYGRMDYFTPMSGLFTTLQRGRPDPKGEFKGEQSFTLRSSGKRMTLRLRSGAGRLDHVAWRILVAACGLCGLNKGDGRFTAEDQEPTLSQLWQLMEVSGHAMTKPALRWQGSIYQFLREAGMGTSKRDYEALYERLERLSMVKQFVEDEPLEGSGIRGKRRASWGSLISFAVDEGSGEMMIAVSPLMARFIMSTGKSPYTRISLSEIRQLKSARAIILHGQLSSIIPDDGRTKKWSVDSLSRLVSGDTAEEHEQIPAARRRKDRERTREAIREINALPGWQIIPEDERGTHYLISRSKAIEAAEAAA